MKVESILSFSFLALSAIAGAQPGYTNHAGNVVAGWPVKLTQKEVSLAEGVVTNGCQLSTNDCRLTTIDNNFSTFQPFNFSTTNTYPLSIFPESEQRRIAADFGQPRVPDAVKRAVTGAEKAIARSRRRAEKGLCTKEESDDFCAKSTAAKEKLVVDGKEVVRPLTAEDVDTIGKACLFNSVNI